MLYSNYLDTFVLIHVNAKRTVFDSLSVDRNASELRFVRKKMFHINAKMSKVTTYFGLFAYMKERNAKIDLWKIVDMNGIRKCNIKQPCPKSNKVECKMRFDTEKICMFEDVVPAEPVALVLYWQKLSMKKVTNFIRGKKYPKYILWMYKMNGKCLLKAGREIHKSVTHVFAVMYTKGTVFIVTHTLVICFIRYDKRRCEPGQSLDGRAMALWFHTILFFQLDLNTTRLILITSNDKIVSGKYEISIYRFDAGHFNGNRGLLLSTPVIDTRITDPPFGNVASDKDGDILISNSSTIQMYRIIPDKV
jgi:hypothetical protein